MMQRHFALLSLLLLVVLTACGGATDPIVGVTALPTQHVTETPGGRILMALPSEAPPTATPLPSLTPDLSTPPYLLTAMPAGGVVCPSPAVVVPPSQPAAYTLYMTAINEFLSQGGTVPFLTGALLAWNAISNEAGLSTDAYDLTGDGVYEVMAIITDPYNAEVAPQPGQLLVYGCDQEDYRLLYASDYGPGYGVPELLYVGDINGDVLPEIVFFQERCQAGSCVQAAQVMSWKAGNDGFVTLNVDTVGSADGRFSIADLDGDGVHELMVQGGGISTNISAGPPRSSTTIWDWNGLYYARALSRLDPPVYRIHMVHDADIAFEAGNYGEASRLYLESLESQRLGTWNVPNEQVMLRAYTLFKLMLTYSVMGEDAAAENVLNTILAENGAGSPSQPYAMLANSYWRRYQETLDLHSACIVAADVMAANPQTVLFLNSYGPANRFYQITDICPF